MKIEEALKQKSFKSPAQKAIINIVYTQSWLQERQMNLFKPLNLSMQQFNVLRILRGQHPKSASVKLVAERMIDKSSNVSRLVEKLRSKNLIERTTCESDRRQVDVKITEEGLALLKSLDSDLLELQDEICGLTEPELDTLNLLLDKFRKDD